MFAAAPLGQASGDEDEEAAEAALARGDARPVHELLQRVGSQFAGNVLKIDVDCVFQSGADMTIEQTHERVSDIEKQIRAKYPGSIVTIHAEPS